MPMTLKPIHLSDPQREELRSWVRRHGISQAIALRASIVLLAAGGSSNEQIAAKLGIHRATVGKWRERFRARGLDGLADGQRTGAPRRIGDDVVEAAIARTLSAPPKGSAQWSTRALAAATGLSQSTVSRIWRAFRLEPHRVETFKLSNDPFFVEKVRDIVGLYMSPPDRALVLCVDEKSQMQALERTQPLLPMRPGARAGQTHDYVRHGTTTLFAALDARTGSVVARCYPRHRSEEFLRFLRVIDDAVPDSLDVHIVMDNYGTHKTEAVRRWFARHPRFHVHFTPTYSSWINLVESWFSVLSRRRLRRGSFTSTRHLERAVREFVDATNEAPRPLTWTKPAEEVLAKVRRFCERNSDSDH